MNKNLPHSSTRFVTVSAYQRISGLSYKTIMHMIKTNQITYIKTESGQYRIDTHSTSNNPNKELLDNINEIQRHVKALCTQFNTDI